MEVKYLFNNFWYSTPNTEIIFWDLTPNTEIISVFGVEYQKLLNKYFTSISDQAKA